MEEKNNTNTVETELIRVEFNGKTWEFDYVEDLDEKHFQKVLATEAPEIVNATPTTLYEDNGRVKVIRFEKKLQYKG